MGRLCASRGRVAPVPVVVRAGSGARASDGGSICLTSRESLRGTVLDPARNEAVGEIAIGRETARIAMPAAGRTLADALDHDQTVEVR